MASKTSVESEMMPPVMSRNAAMKRAEQAYASEGALTISRRERAMGVFARMKPGKAMMPGTGVGEVAMILSESLVEVVMAKKMPLPEMGVDGCEKGGVEMDWVRIEV